MKFGMKLATVAILGLLVTSFVGAEEAKKDDVKKPETKKVDMEKIIKVTKCPISGGPAKLDKMVAYRDSKVFVCCGNCVKAFPSKVKKDKMLAAKANLQLVMTKQAEQKKCCLNGKGPVNKDAHTKFAGVQVHTCCKNCLAKVKDMDEKAQLELISKNFDKAFVVKAEEKKKKEAAKKKAA